MYIEVDKFLKNIEKKFFIDENDNSDNAKLAKNIKNMIIETINETEPFTDRDYLNKRAEEIRKKREKEFLEKMVQNNSNAEELLKNFK